MVDYQILSWHGIPTGVKARDGRLQARTSLPRRFQIAVDAVASACGHTGTSDYLAGWQWSDWTEREGTAREVADAVAAELEAAYPPSRVQQIRRDLEQQLKRVNGDQPTKKSHK